MHPDLPGKTDFFGYTDLYTFDQKYLAGAIVAKRGTPVLLTVTNLLPNRHILPVDPTMMAGPNGQTVGDLPTNRIATHLHGGATPWFSDGTPFQWFTPTGKHGSSFMNVPGFPVLPGRNLLLSQRSECTSGVVSRPRDRDYTAERVCGNRVGLHHRRRL